MPEFNLCTICHKRETLTDYCKDCNYLLNNNVIKFTKCNKCKQTKKCVNISSVLQNPMWRCDECES